jgi:hypothetical protein
LLADNQQRKLFMVLFLPLCQSSSSIIIIIINIINSSLHLLFALIRSSTYNPTFYLPTFPLFPLLFAPSRSPNLLPSFPHTSNPDFHEPPHPARSLVSFRLSLSSVRLIPLFFFFLKKKKKKKGVFTPSTPNPYRIPCHAMPCHRFSLSPFPHHLKSSPLSFPLTPTQPNPTQPNPTTQPPHPTSTPKVIQTPHTLFTTPIPKTVFTHVYPSVENRNRVEMF